MYGGEGGGHPRVGHRGVFMSGGGGAGVCPCYLRISQESMFQFIQMSGADPGILEGGGADRQGHPSIHPPIHPSIHPPIHPSIQPSIHPFIHSYMIHIHYIVHT